MYLETALFLFTWVGSNSIPIRSQLNILSDAGRILVLTSVCFRDNRSLLKMSQSINMLRMRHAFNFSEKPY